MDLNKLAFVDIETTGARAHSDRIIEVGILRVENDTIVSQYQSLINPHAYVSPFIEQMTGINATELESAPSFEDVSYKILELIEGCIFVAHNARFDFSFLKNEYKNIGIQFSPKQLCSVKLSRHLFPQYTRHNLDSIIERFNISCENRHRALGDAQVIWEFYKKLSTFFSQETITNSVRSLIKQPSLPSHLPTDILESLPEGAGVYIFYGDKDIPLYIGKSINIRERVLSHFSADHTSAKEMSISQQIKNIETITTAGELGALLLESSLIKKMQPLYNHALRNSHQLYILKQSSTNNQYYTLHLEAVDTITPDLLPEICGIFRSKKQAKDFLNKIAKEHQLCEKLLGIDTTSTSCFSHKLGKCKGACVGKEKPLAYNIRFTEAISATKIKRWPFKGSISVYEQNEDTGNEQEFRLDNWCLIDDNSSYIFDYDTYKILLRYIFNKKNIARIKNISYYDSSS